MVFRGSINSTRLCGFFFFPLLFFLGALFAYKLRGDVTSMWWSPPPTSVTTHTLHPIKSLPSPLLGVVALLQPFTLQTPFLHLYGPDSFYLSVSPTSSTHILSLQISSLPAVSPPHTWLLPVMPTSCRPTLHPHQI